MVSAAKRAAAKEKKARERAAAAADHAARAQSKRTGWRSVPTWQWLAVAVAAWAILEGCRRAFFAPPTKAEKEHVLDLKYSMKDVNVPRALLARADASIPREPDAIAAARAAREGPAFRGVFHRNPDVHVWDDFLTDAECDEIVALADEAPESSDPQGLDGGWAYLDAGRKNGYMYVSPTPTRPILVEIERRIANWTGYAVHPEETGMKIKRQGNTGQKADAGVVHLDINHRPWRRATVIFYCNDMDETHGGATVFPCLTPDPEPGSLLSDAATTEEAVNRTKYLAKVEGIRHRQCAEAAGNVRRNARGQRSMGGERGYRYAFTEMDKDEDGTLYVSAKRMCKALKEGGAGATSRGRQAGGMADGRPGIYVQPRKGRAVMFRKTSHEHTWHAACEVREGTKWAAQKFKELPMPLRAGERRAGTAWRTDTLFEHSVEGIRGST